MFKKFCCLLMAFSVLNLSLFAASPLRRGTTVYVRNLADVTSKEGTISAVVDNDVKTKDGVVAIEKGARVNVTYECKKARGVGKPGKIIITSMSTETVDGQSVLLTGSFTATGESKKGKALGLGLGLGLYAWPFIFFLCKKGGQATIPAGTVFSQFSTADEYQIGQ